MGRRCVSQLLAVLICISLCLAAALTVLFAVYGAFQLSTRSYVVEVDASLVKDESGPCLRFQVKNLASSPMVGLWVKLDGEDWIQIGEVNVGNPLEYGQEKFFVVSGDQLTGSYRVGEYYTLVVKAEFADGGVTVTTRGVYCEWRYA